MKFRTEVSKQAYTIHKLNYYHKIMAIGSCFVENIGQQLTDLRYPIIVNPFGILYNPSSVAKALHILLRGKIYREADIFEHKGIWNSFDHHSRFSAQDASELLTNINTTLERARQQLQQLDYLFITLGTAWIFEQVESGEVVGNCHRLPSNQFKRRRMEVSEIINGWNVLIQQLKIQRPNLKIILTISPIRHIKDGLVENNLSKAILRLAVQELVDTHTNVDYFPAYELLIDDLRDYRFYKEDLVHPNHLGITYIWEQVEAYLLDEEEAPLRKKIIALQKAIRHRPFFEDSEEYQRFKAQQKNKLAFLTRTYPHINWLDAIEHFN